MDDRGFAKSYAASRAAVGLLLFLFPGRVLKGMLGGRDVPAGVALIGRLLGARDAILGAGAIAALQDNHPHSVRPWMAYGMVADASDALGMLVAYRHLPRRKRFVMLSMALGGAGAGGYLMTRFED